MGLPEQYPLGAIFPSGKAEIAAIRQEEARRRSQSAFRSARARLEREKRLALNDIRAQPFNLQPKIKMRLLPLWRG